MGGRERGGLCYAKARERNEERGNEGKRGQQRDPRAVDDGPKKPAFFLHAGARDRCDAGAYASVQPRATRRR